MPDFCGACGETFIERPALDAHQLKTGHEMDQPDHPLRQEPAMLNPLIAWEPGLLVDYRGSLTDLHGQYEAHPCGCLNCTDNRDLPGVRFELRDEHGAVIVACVRPRSITPHDRSPAC